MYHSLVQPLYGLPALTISPSKQQWLTDLPSKSWPISATQRPSVVIMHPTMSSLQ